MELHSLHEQSLKRGQEVRKLIRLVFTLCNAHSASQYKAELQIELARQETSRLKIQENESQLRSNLAAAWAAEATLLATETLKTVAVEFGNLGGDSEETRRILDDFVRGITLVAEGLLPAIRDREQRELVVVKTQQLIVKTQQLIVKTQLVDRVVALADSNPDVASLTEEVLRACVDAPLSASLAAPAPSLNASEAVLVSQMWADFKAATQEPDKNTFFKVFMGLARVMFGEIPEVSAVS